MEEGEGVGDGRSEGSSAVGHGGQAAFSLTPDADGTPILIFEGSGLEGYYVRDLLYLVYLLTCLYLSLLLILIELSYT